MADQEHLVEQFMNVTGESRYLADQYLQRNKNDVVSAIEDYYSNKTSTTKKSKISGGVNTFRDLNNDEDDSEDDKTNTNFFTGGEKSGLQVEDPNKKNKKRDQSIIDQIFQKAKEQMDQPDDRPSAQEIESNPKKFRGTGFKLGDSVVPSQEIKDELASAPEKPVKVNRELTFWKQGFTVGDGPLHRYDDPSNAHVLQELNQGRVPMSLLDVEFGQDVDVSVFRKTDEDWVPPKRKVGGFVGSGQRLGSPVPGDYTEEVEEPKATPASTATDSGKEPEANGEGDIAVNIRFATGKRVSFKFYSSDPITKVYDAVRNHPFTTPGKSFTLGHAFPLKAIEESSEITVEDAKLKNAVIVQRWI